MKIAFAGTPLAAVPTLTALIASDHEVALVVTRPDAPAGRGRTLTSSPVADVAGMNAAPNVYAFGFLLGPRINAAGRIGGSGLWVKLLACNNSDEAAGLALRLNEMNHERKQIEEGIRIAAIDRAAEIHHPVLIMHDPSWHEGVIGIVAGRVRARHRCSR